MHALVGPDNTVIKYSSDYAGFDPAVGVKPGYRWVPVESETVGTPGPLMGASDSVIVEQARVVKRTTHAAIAIDSQKMAVKNEARRRILARFPELKQTNMVARGVELQEIWRQSAAWTAEEQAEANALAAARGWIKAVRAASDLLELMNPIPGDFNNDRHWPA